MKNKSQLIQTIIAAVVTIVLIVLIVKPSGNSSFNNDASTYFDMTPEEVQQLIQNAGLEYDESMSGDYDGYHVDMYRDDSLVLLVDSDGYTYGIVLNPGDKYHFGELSVGDTYEGAGNCEKLVNSGWAYDNGYGMFDYWKKDDKSMEVGYENGVITYIMVTNLDYAYESGLLSEEDVTEEAVETEGQTEIMQSEISGNKPEIQISDIFVPSENATSWSLSNESGTYYMIPVISDGTNTIYFNSSNELAGYAEVYYMDVESIGQTANGGLSATGTMYSNSDSPVSNGKFTVTWDSYESMDWATVEAIDGTEMTDTSMVGEYSYYGMVSEGEETASNNGYTTMYVVNCNESITLRTSPSTDAAAIRQIPLGEPVSFIEPAANGFYMISYMGDTGYALASYLATADGSSVEGGYQTLKVVNCNESITLRTEPSTSAPEIRQIPLGATVSFIETAENGYYKVTYLSDTGYALASYLEFI